MRADFILLPNRLQLTKIEMYFQDGEKFIGKEFQILAIFIIVIMIIILLLCLSFLDWLRLMKRVRGEGGGMRNTHFRNG